MAIYNWQQKDWKRFSFSLDNAEDELLLFARKEGRVSGILDSLLKETQLEAIVDNMLTEAIKTSAIEGEFPNRKDVLSSIRKNLGLQNSAILIKDKSASGLAKLMIDVRKSFNEPLTEKKLFGWHKLLMGTNKRIAVGKWRSHHEPMQVVSGALGKEKIHFIAPPSSIVAKEMKDFIKWFNDTAPGGKNEMMNAAVRSAIAHLYFESIHPFEDGNGRIGRAIAEKALSQTIGRPVLLSLSGIIEANKKDYYSTLEKAQRSNEITDWISYFIKTLLNAQIEAEVKIEFILKKTRFFDLFKDKLNERQKKVIGKMFDAGSKGFEGGMNARKYIAITKLSKATATRDLQYLLEIGAFIQSGKGGGRSTSYQLNLNNE